MQCSVLFNAIANRIEPNNNRIVSDGIQNKYSVPSICFDNENKMLIIVFIFKNSLNIRYSNKTRGNGKRKCYYLFV